jgi:hypothetical protein
VGAYTPSHSAFADFTGDGVLDIAAVVAWPPADEWGLYTGLALVPGRRVSTPAPTAEGDTGFSPFNVDHSVSSSPTLPSSRRSASSLDSREDGAVVMAVPSVEDTPRVHQTEASGSSQRLTIARKRPVTSIFFNDPQTLTEEPINVLGK